MRKFPIGNNQCITDRPVSVCAFLCTLLVQFFRIFTLSLYFDHVALFSCCTLSMFCYFQCTLFPCCILFMLHFFHVALFPFCTFFTFRCSNIHFSRVALFLCCTYFVFHYFHVALFLC